MHIHRYPLLTQASQLLRRPVGDLALYREKTAAILQAIRTEGDTAARRYAAQFDGPPPAQWEVPEADFLTAENQLPESLKSAIRQAYHNIRNFHAAQRMPTQLVETMPGVRCWRESLPLEKVGLYIPGGTAPLFSTVLMLGVPAQIAACPNVVLCTPPRQDGSVHPAILFAAQLCGIRKVLRIGGVQAIGALAYGTETIPAVHKIFGPGNPWVTAAKQLVSLDAVAIDLPAGPSEVAVVADDSANPDFIAADLLSQAEHGADSQVLLVCTSEHILEKTATALQNQLKALPRRALAEQAMQHSKALLVSSLETAMEWVNAYAPEHLILSVREPERWAASVRHAGSVFLGHWTPESAGDYASGTNHTLPTGGYARAYAGVSLDSFVKNITFQQISREGLQQLGPVITEMARAEGLEGHARAVEERINVANVANETNVANFDNVANVANETNVANLDNVANMDNETNAANEINVANEMTPSDLSDPF
jgi:histidinol dehydrogenase